MVAIAKEAGFSISIDLLKKSKMELAELEEEVAGGGNCGGCCTTNGCQEARGESIIILEKFC